MSLGRIAIAVSAVALCAAIIMLAVKVGSTPEPPVIARRPVPVSAQREPAPPPPPSAPPAAETHAPPARVAPPPPDDNARNRAKPLWGSRTKLADQAGAVTSTAMMAAEKPLAAQVKSADQFYREGDYEAAMEAAVTALREKPDDLSALRIAVAAACVTGNEDIARAHYPRLVGRHRVEMKARCKEYGVSFDD